MDRQSSNNSDWVGEGSSKGDASNVAANSPTGSTLDLTGASIREVIDRKEPAPSIELPNQDADYISHIALDIGGTLIKLVYFSPDPPSDHPTRESPAGSIREAGVASRVADRLPAVQTMGNTISRGGRLHFVKFESSRVEDAIQFIEAKGLHKCKGSSGQIRVKATGGGAHKYSDIFKEKLGVLLEKEDEMMCLVGGCNFFLKAITHEAFTYESGTTRFVPTNEEVDLYPYLLVNIGSGVSVVKVTGEGEFERVSGSSLGGGTFSGLCRLLTQRKDFDEMLELSMQGDNSKVDMLVGDIYGGRDYSNIGLSANTIASSFGKVISQDAPLSEYNPADISMALCRMVSYNIGQLAYLNAIRYNIKRIFFGGFFIRGHPYTMETISYAIRFWSKGEMAAMFLRHEGFLGAMGAFLKVHPMTHVPGRASSAAQQPQKVRARFVERFSMGAPFAGGEVVGPAISDLQEKVSWVEKFVALGDMRTAAQGSGASAPGGGLPADANSEGEDTLGAPPSSGIQGAGALRKVSQPSVEPMSPRGIQPIRRTCSEASHAAALPGVRMPLHVGVLHYSPSYDVFPLLADPSSYEPNTFGDVARDEDEWTYWLKILEDQIPTIVQKAIHSEGGGHIAQRRAAAFGRAFAAHLVKLRSEPGAYGALGLAELFELREECLHEFGFSDAYRLEKERESAAALAVLHDLLAELDSMSSLEERMLALVQGALAANIFDWGAKACVALYQAGTILEIYREARAKLSKRPWALDDFDKFLSRTKRPYNGSSTPGMPPYRRILMFVDNSGADVVLGQLPLARELLRMGCEVLLVANKLPAINDVTASELAGIVASAERMCPIIHAARDAARRVECSSGGMVPPYPGAQQVKRSPSHAKLAGLQAMANNGGGMTDGGNGHNAEAGASSSGVGCSTRAERASMSGGASTSGMASTVGNEVPGPKLYIVHNGQGSPCLDFRRVPDLLAEACSGTDLIIIEGMGRAIHTNLYASFLCDSLKLAMIKTERLSKKLFGPHGALYDCVCKYEEGQSLR